MSDFDKLSDLIYYHREAGPLASINMDRGILDTIAVAGAFRGDTMAFLRRLYPRASMYGFEPQKWAFEQLRARFSDDDNTVVYPYGLGAVEEPIVADLYDHDNDAASFIEYPDARKKDLGTLFPITKTHPFGGVQGVRTTVTLCVFNMEGYEWLLLPHMHETGLLYNVHNLVLQSHYHSVSDDEVARVLGLLGEDHMRVWASADWSWWVHR